MRFGKNTGWKIGFITTPVRTLTKEQISMFSLDSFGYHKHGIWERCPAETTQKISSLSKIKLTCPGLNVSAVLERCR